MGRKQRILEGKTQSQWIGQEDKTLIYERRGVVFTFNFHPAQSYSGYFVPVKEPGEYRVILSTDDREFGGYDRISTTYVYTAVQQPDGRLGFRVYLPSRTAMVLKRLPRKK